MLLYLRLLSSITTLLDVGGQNVLEILIANANHFFTWILNTQYMIYMSFQVTLTKKYQRMSIRARLRDFFPVTFSADFHRQSLNSIQKLEPCNFLHAFSLHIIRCILIPTNRNILPYQQVCHNTLRGDADCDRCKSIGT